MKYYESLTREEAVNLASSKFKQSLTVPLPFYKGIYWEGTLSDYYYLNPTKFIRTSKTVTENGNAYNLLFNNLPSWEVYPKRSKSIIACTDYNVASSFAHKYKGDLTAIGKIYRVFPEYNYDVAFAPKEDIWYSFRKGLSHFALRGFDVDLVTFNLAMKNIFDLAGVDDSVNFDYNLFIETIKNLATGSLTPKGSLCFKAELLLLSLKRRKDDIEMFLNNAFEPSANGIELREFNHNLVKTNYPKNEIWGESPCLLIENNKLDSFKNLL